jgi:hypothetical protein
MATLGMLSLDVLELGLTSLLVEAWPQVAPLMEVAVAVSARSMYEAGLTMAATALCILGICQRMHPLPD